MARGDHPQRTPFYGALLIVAAMMAGLAVRVWSRPPLPVTVAVLIVALLAAIIGLGMTLRDRTPPR